MDLELAIIEQAYRDEFQRRDQQVQRLATLGQVSSGIAHELRNPLNVIKTSTYFLLNARQPSDEKRREHLERIERQVDMASEVISAISEFAKVADPALEELDLAEQLSGWLSQVGGLESTVVQHEASCTSPVLGDSRLLQIAIANILRNASEAMEGKGQVDVTLKENGEHVRLEFVDSGPGIPLDIRARVTEPWFSTKARGTGLGLAITKAILDRHQADLQIEDGEQGGTRMQIDIPKASFVRTSGELS